MDFRSVGFSYRLFLIAHIIQAKNKNEHMKTTIIRLFPKLLLLILFALHTHVSFCQKKTQVTVNLAPVMTSKRLTVSIDNGVSEKKITPVIINNTFTIEKNYYGRCATITFSYPDSTEINGVPCFSFWVSDTPATIDFYQTGDKRNNPLHNYKLTNVIALASIGQDAYSKHIEKENREVKNYYLTYRDSLDNPKYATIFEQKQTNVALKGLEYIKANVNSYLALFLFKHEYASSSRLPAKNLLQYFRTVFPDSLQQTFEGKEIVKRLNGCINTKKGGEAPDFTMKDTHSNTVTLSALKGKFVLLDFWASWCGPCRRLTPLLKAIREKYQEEKLTIIALSLDDDEQAFKAALEKDQPTWTQIFADDNLRNSYAIGSIPHLLLIDGRGMVVYNMEEENDYDIKKLEKLLQETIAKM